MPQKPWRARRARRATGVQQPPTWCPIDVNVTGLFRLRVVNGAFATGPSGNNVAAIDDRLSSFSIRGESDRLTLRAALTGFESSRHTPPRLK